METQRIKVKVGEHEFDAEGPVEIVQRQFQDWKELIAIAPSPSHVTTEQRANQVATDRNAGSGGSTTQFDKIFRVEGRVVSLTVRPESEAVAALLVLLGQNIFRNTEIVTASEVRDGMEHSGYRFARVDRLMQPLCDEGLVIKIGTRKATRYRLTNLGSIRAQTAANEAIAQVT